MEIVAPASRLTSTAIARELLGLPKPAADLLLKAQPAEPWTLWGLTKSVVDLRDARDGTLVSGDWDELLRCRASILLQQSGLSFSDLLGVLDTRYVNQSGVTPTVQGDPCDVTKMQVPWLTPSKLQRLHRFVRLWRTLGWRIEDVDRALAARGGDIDADMLVWLSHLERLRIHLRLPVMTLVGWWSKLDTRVYLDHARDGMPLPSPYDRVFGDPRVINPPDPALGLNATRDELADPSQTISAHRAAVAAGLGISAPDLGRLLAHEVPDKLTLANLSRLQAIADLTRGLRLSIPDFLRIRALCDLQPFPAADGAASARSAATLAFIGEVERIRNSGFTLPELDYLLLHGRSSAAPVGPSLADLVAILAELRSGLQGIGRQLREIDDEGGETTRRLLAQLGWTANLVEAAGAALGTELRSAVPLTRLPSGVSFPAQLPKALVGKVGFDPDAHELSCLGALRDSERDALLAVPATRSGAEYAAYEQATRDLHARSRAELPESTAFVRHQMQSLVLSRFSVPLELSAKLANLPAGVTIPDELPAELRTRMSFDAAGGQLRLRGSLSATQRERLLELAPDDDAWVAALAALVLPVDVPGTPDRTLRARCRDR